MNNQTIARNTFRVGYRYRCTMSLADGAVNVEWQPHLPKYLSEGEKRDYRTGRDTFLAQIVGPDKTIGVMEVG